LFVVFVAVTANVAFGELPHPPQYDRNSYLEQVRLKAQARASADNGRVSNANVTAFEEKVEERLSKVNKTKAEDLFAATHPWLVRSGGNGTVDNGLSEVNKTAVAERVEQSHPTAAAAVSAVEEKLEEKVSNANVTAFEENLEERLSKVNKTKAEDVFAATHPWAVRFAKWAKEHNKTYESKEEEQYRQRVYQENVQYIEAHNKKQLSYTLGENAFCDLTTTEFQNKYLSKFKPSKASQVEFGSSSKKTFLAKNSLSSTPPDIAAGIASVNEVDPVTPPGYPPSLQFPVGGDVDWRGYHCVGTVKNQAQCGDCWAFAAAAAMEANYCISHFVYGQPLEHLYPTSLSAQQLLDCSDVVNEGCDGGNYDVAFVYALAYGMDSWEDYPYTGKQGTCKAGRLPVNETISGFRKIQPNNETALAVSVCYGVTAVAIQANQPGFQFYKSGIYDGTCGDNLDHAVVVIGYGVNQTTNQEYWTIKNSWGVTWGNDGFMNLAKGVPQEGGQCGILSMPTRPIANNTLF
jgi:hypothetical protein